MKTILGQTASGVDESVCLSADTETNNKPCESAPSSPAPTPASSPVRVAPPEEQQSNTPELSLSPNNSTGKSVENLTASPLAAALPLSQPTEISSTPFAGSNEPSEASLPVSPDTSSSGPDLNLKNDQLAIQLSEQSVQQQAPVEAVLPKPAAQEPKANLSKRRATFSQVLQAPIKPRKPALQKTPTDPSLVPRTFIVRNMSSSKPQILLPAATVMPTSNKSEVTSSPTPVSELPPILTSDMTPTEPLLSNSTSQSSSNLNSARVPLQPQPPSYPKPSISQSRTKSYTSVVPQALPTDDDDFISVSDSDED